ncbi:MAG: hypothetical protein LLG05_07110, partial [Porphyromonadaceae bacterium]|nr:hypothetical protein [Porphyromonadaceae bacterium]
MSDTPKVRIELTPHCYVPDRQVKINVRRTKAKDYKKATWGVFRYPPCAVVGGGLSVSAYLETLKNWQGDIFAINDTAGYLSDNGIKCYLFAIDCTPTQFKIGENVKGALMATRCHRNQFKQFPYEKIIVFDMAEEDNIGGIEGGPTAVCRTPHLLLRMGYSSVHYFGIDGSFVGQSHINQNQKYAYDKMMVIKANGKTYLTNGALQLQNQYMVNVFKKYGQFLKNQSEGLIKDLLADKDNWEVVAVSKDLKDEFDAAG